MPTYTRQATWAGTSYARDVRHIRVFLHSIPSPSRCSSRCTQPFKCPCRRSDVVWPHHCRPAYSPPTSPESRRTPRARSISRFAWFWMAGADGAWSVAPSVRRLFTHLIDIPDQSVEFFPRHRRGPSEQRGLGVGQRRFDGFGRIGGHGLFPLHIVPRRGPRLVVVWRATWRDPTRVRRWRGVGRAPRRHRGHTQRKGKRRRQD